MATSKNFKTIKKSNCMNIVTSTFVIVIGLLLNIVILFMNMINFEDYKCF